MRPKEAIIAALNEAFPTIFTSGTILAVAGALIGVMTTNPVIAAIGTCLGRGTVISIVLVMAVLPQILLIGDTIVERTSFDVKVPVDLSRVNRTASGNMRVSGRVRGYVNGVIDAEIKGTLNGTLKASVTSGTTIEPTKPDFICRKARNKRRLNGQNIIRKGRKSDGTQYSKTHAGKTPLCVYLPVYVGAMLPAQVFAEEADTAQTETVQDTAPKIRSTFPVRMT